MHAATEVDDAGAGTWTVTNRGGEALIITVEQVLHDSAHELGVDPGLSKDGVEAHLQQLLAEQVHRLGEGWRWCVGSSPPPSARST